MNNKQKNMTRAFVAGILLTAISLSGCAYFNTFFNAKQAYKRGLRAVEADPEGNVSGNALTDFNLAIEKASKLLELYQGSRYTDDALLMIGRCYYFMGEFDRSKRSLEDLFNNLPDSKLVPEARAVYAQILLEEDRPGLVELEYQRIIENERSNQNQRNEAYFGLANLMIYREDYDGAIAQLENLIESAQDNEFRSEIQLKIAQSYYEKGEFQTAAEKFEKINEFEPTLEIEFLGYMGRGDCLINLELFDEAVTFYREILVKPEFWEDYVDIYIELARVREVSGNEDAAITILQESNYFDPVDGKLKLDSLRVEVPPDTSIKDSLGQTVFTEPTIRVTPPAPVKINPEPEFYIGEIYFKKKYDFERAKEHYESAQSAAPPPELVPEIRNRVGIIDEITRLNQAVFELPPKIPVLDDDPEKLIVWKDSILALPDMILTDLEPLVSMTRDTVRLDTVNLDSTEIVIDTTYIARQDTVLKSAVLDTSRFKLIDELLAIKDSIILAVDLDSTSNSADYLVTPDLSVFLNTYNNYPEAVFRFNLNSIRSYYRLAEIYDIELIDPDSSNYKLDYILNNYPDNEYAPKTLLYKFDIASRYELDNADELRSMLINNYGGSLYARFLAGDSAIISTDDVVFNPFEVDSGEIKYRSAEKELFDGNLEEAIRQFDYIRKFHTESNSRSKAIYAVAWIYENELKDNAKAIEYYELLKTQYGGSEYGRAAAEKLVEVERLRMVIETNRRIFQQQLRDIIQIKLTQSFSDTAGVITLDSLSSITVRDSLRIVVTDSLVVFNRIENLVHDELYSSYADSVGVIYLDSLSYVIVSDSLRNFFSDSLREIIIDSLAASRVVIDTAVTFEQDSTEIVLPDITGVTVPDTTEFTLPDTAIIPEPDTTGLLKPDSTGVIKPDSTGVIKPDSTGVIKPDSTGVIKPDSTGVIKPDTTKNGFDWNIP
ncbi:MAG: tetratricopeptide repeat protein [bacterium]|nr:tetratricopeptide repeat protein [bacterium]